MLFRSINIDKVLKSEVDFKSRLIEWGQKNRIDVRFEVIDSSYDNLNNPVFVSCVKVGEVEIGTGKGYSKKESHQKAAKMAIKKLRESNELQDTLIDSSKQDLKDTED